MRRFASLPILALLTWGQPAQADIVAEYYVWGPIGPSMRVEVADNGNGRIRMGGETVAIRRDGIVYLVRGDERGSFVIREDEFWRIEARKNRELGGFPGSDDLAMTRLVERGVETVGGREGVVLLLESPDQPSPDTNHAFVVSADPDLAPVGSLVSTIFGSGLGIPGPFGTQFREIQARGTLIRMSFMLRLERTSHEPIPPTAFELPGPVLNGEEAEVRLGRAW